MLGKVISNQRILYLANVKDFYETKQVLVNVLGFCFAY